MLFSVLAALPFLGKAYHMDEPVFLYTARHLLLDPLRPGLFAFNWYGAASTMAQVNNNPPLLAYLLAPVIALTGEREWLTRLAFLPFDALAAASLYLLAARFLERPWWPVLTVLACPAYLVNMEHLMAEKPAMALGAAGLACLVHGVEEGKPRWEAGSIALLASAMLAKYGAALFLAPAAAFLLSRRRSMESVVGFCSWALLPVFAVVLWLDLAGLGGLMPALGVLGRSHASWDWRVQMRSFLAFSGGCGVVTAFWPYLSLGRRWGVLCVCLAAALVLLRPSFDTEPVRPLDRATGLVFAVGALAGFAAMLTEGARRSRGWALWAGWVAAAALLQFALYWGVMARIVLFLVPPLVFLTAGCLEAALPARRLTALYAAGFALTCALGFGAAVVDRRYADSQRAFARETVGPFLAQGRRAHFIGHWGLQYYLEAAGATPIDESGEGYDAIRSGDLFLVSRVNSNNSLLGRPRLARDHVFGKERHIRVESRVPLRLISGWSGQGGFYADSWGFLPFSLSREPVEEFALGEHL
ncbi:MAG: glycosyltransferase family 39 protein [Elusimicrobia bacterium]|nr:glycosyltransferase family 39 protein [Elusimicrobiota bacterium]